MKNLKHRLNQLFERSDFPEDAFDLDNAFKGKPIILYGAGESSIWFFEIVRDMFGYSPNVILDKKFDEPTLFEGGQAMSPEHYVSNKAHLGEAIVVVCLGSEKAEKSVYNWLNAVGFKNIMKLRDIYEIHNPFSKPNNLFLEGYPFFKKRQKNILDAFEMFEDELSQTIYFQFLKTHMSRKPICLENQPSEEQYFPQDVPLHKGYQRFINCGSYDGDVIRLLNEKIGFIDEMVCIEADPKIFHRLATYLYENQSKLAQSITALPCAVFSENKRVLFTEATGLGSRISDSGTLDVQAISLDDVFPSFSPTMITMDIEGAELDALMGAEKMIKKHVPDLAICVYHQPNHLWDIALYLKQLDLGYKFYLRNYTSFTIETVLYATK